MSGDDRDPIEQLAEEFLARYRNGEHPSVKEYAKQNPQLSQKIHDLFPTLLLMEKFCPSDVASDAGSNLGSDRTPIKEQFGEYQIVRTIGRGGMGVVYEAIHQSLDRHVALKVLPHSQLRGEVGRARFRQEARAAARLHHTNIVPVFDVGECDGVPYYAMQFIRGRSLNEVVDMRRTWRSTGAASELDTDEAGKDATKKPIKRPSSSERPKSIAGISGTGDQESSSRAAIDHRDSRTPWFAVETDARYYGVIANIGLQVAHALSFVHGQDMLHRDIKPSNLILDADDRIWITDFGLAKTSGSDDLTHTGGIVGTLRFMAPERFRGISESASDIYSLGATLYELLTEQPAFIDEDRVRLIERIKNEEPTPPRKINPRIPIDLETIVLKAMEKDPNRRYLTAAELADDFNRWLNREPIRARPISLMGRAIRWSQRRPLVASLSASIMVLTIIGFSLVTWKWREADRHRILAETNAQRAQDVVHEFYSEVSQSWGLLHMSPGTQQLRKNLLGKAEQHFEKFLQENRTSATEFQLAHANYCLGDIFADTGEFDRAKNHYRRGIESLENLVDADPKKLEYQHILGHCYSGLARLVDLSEGPAAAITIYEAALAVFDQLSRYEPDSTEFANDVASVRANLGSALLVTGKFDLASQHHEISIQIREQIANPNFSIKKGLAVSYRKLGDLLRRKSKLVEAIELYEKTFDALKELQRQYPQIDWIQGDFGACCVVLGSAYRQAGKLELARNVCQQGIQVLEKLRAENPGVPAHELLLAKVYNNSANIHNRMGNSEISTRQFEQALEIRQQLVSDFPDIIPYRDGLATSKQNLALNYRRDGKLVRALELIRESISIRESMRDEQSTVADYQNNLAEAYCEMGSTLLWHGQRDQHSIENATELFNDAVSIGEQLCNEYPDVARYRSGLADSYLQLAKCLSLSVEKQPFVHDGVVSKDASDQTVELFQKSIAIQKELIKQQPSIVEFQKNLSLAHLNLGILHHRVGNSEQGIKQMEQAIAMQHAICDANPNGAMLRLELITFYNSLGYSLHIDGALDKAIDAYSKSISIGSELFQNHSAVIPFQLALADSRDKLAAIYEAQNEPAQAIKQYLQAHTTTDHIDTELLTSEQKRKFANRYSTLAKLYENKKERAKAIDFYLAGIDLRKQLTQSHPNRRDYQNELARDHNNLGNVYLNENKLSSAYNHFTFAANLRSVMDRPTAPSWELKGLAISYFSLAKIDQAQGRLDDALSNFEKAIETRIRITAIAPADAENKHSLGSHHINFGSAFRQLQQPRMAEKQYTAALDIHEQLVADHPDDIRYEVSRLGSHVNVSLAMRDQGQYQKSLALLEIAETGLQEILTKHADNPRAKSFLTNCRNAQTNTHHLLGHRLANEPGENANRQQALEHARLACEISGWRRSDCIDLLAFVYATLGDFEKAVEYELKAIGLVDEHSQSLLKQRLELYRQKKLPPKT